MEACLFPRSSVAFRARTGLLALAATIFAVLRSAPTLAAPTFITIDPPGAVSSAAFSINAHGDIAGVYDDQLSFHGYVRAAGGGPNSGILTQRDCCKHPWEIKLWGGFLGNYEGNIPSFDGGRVDRRRRWCDNLSNNDRFVLESITRAVADVTFKLANEASLGRLKPQ